MSDDKFIRELWAGQEAGGFAMPLDEVRRRAGRFQRTVRLRNMTEYAAAVLVIGIFGWMAVVIPEPVVKAGCALVAAGAVYVCWKLHTLARAAGAARMDAALDLTAFHRAELMRQRAALATVWRWYLAPFVPGMIVFQAGVAFTPDNPAPLAAKLVILLIGLGLSGAIFAVIWWLNARAARALDAEIAALGE